MTEDPGTWMQQALLKHVGDVASKECSDELRTTVAPRICKELDDDAKVVSSLQHITGPTPIRTSAWYVAGVLD